MTGSSKEQPIDEGAALAELERFRRDIERYRVQREAVGQTFDRFIESFPAPEDVFPSEAAPADRAPEPRSAPTPETIPLPPLPKRETRTGAPAPTPPADVKAAPAPPRPSASVPERAVAPPPVAPASRAAQSVSAAAKDVDAATDAMVAGPQTSKRTPIFAAVILIVLVVGAFAMWTLRRGTTAPEQQTSPPAAAPAQLPAAPPPAAPAVVPVESEITTIRRAWVRVIADGERVVERELPADSRIPFKADKTITVRTGDAGAVKLSIRGQDQGAMGRDGQVVTRTFTVPDAPSR